MRRWTWQQRAVHGARAYLSRSTWASRFFYGAYAGLADCLDPRATLRPTAAGCYVAAAGLRARSAQQGTDRHRAARRGGHALYIAQARFRLAAQAAFIDLRGTVPARLRRRGSSPFRSPIRNSRGFSSCTSIYSATRRPSISATNHGLLFQSRSSRPASCRGCIHHWSMRSGTRYKGRAKARASIRCIFRCLGRLHICVLFRVRLQAAVWYILPIFPALALLIGCA